ncbi:hypothetical protein BKG93_07835 [Rodentibacter ratti]|uniref:Uncharacterized protein n=1 Tax=Rodentibacter ratti TaxID=1906745 RepID=A0A1V3L3D4_9PAST|nr:hypothetical protein [Rodentibacter ratti]OOF84432.1 hypothetical protein BKG93_07835 [Rodentibacter ratti]
MAVTVQADFKGARQLIEKLQSLKDKAVYVGFPAEFNEPVEGAKNFNLASLAAVLEFGNEHIPSRPFLRQTLEKNREKYTALFVQLFERGMSVEKIYESIANIAEGDVKKNIVKGQWAENADSTKIAWRLKDVKNPKRRRKIRETLDPKSIKKKPLIWNGKMRQSVRGIVK